MTNPTLERLSAVKRTPERTSHNLGNALGSAFRQFGVMSDEEAAEARRKAVAEVEAAGRRHLQALGFPALHLRRDLGNMIFEFGKWGTAVLATHDALKAGKLVAMTGPRGTGKTQAAACLAWVSSHRESARYIRVVELFRQIRDSFNRRDVREQDIIDRYSCCGFLVIDEVHERSQSEFEQRVLTEIFDRRYADRRATLAISNLTPDALMKSLGDSIASRFEEAGAIVEFSGWPSFRSPA